MKLKKLNDKKKTKKKKKCDAEKEMSHSVMKFDLNIVVEQFYCPLDADGHVNSYGAYFIGTFIVVVFFICFSLSIYNVNELYI